MSNARLAHGAKIKMGDGATPTEAFSDIGELQDFDVNDSQELVDVTNHQSGGRKEYIADVIDADEISFTVNYDDADATHNATTGLRSKLGQKVNFQVEAPGDTNGSQFAAIVTAVGRSMPVSGGALSMNVTIKPTGAVTSYVIS